MENDRVSNYNKNVGKNKKLFTIFIIILFFCLLGVGVWCISNINYVNNTIFNLNGQELIELETGTVWSDPFVIAIYDNESIIDDVIVEGNVNTDIPARYEVTYTIRKGLSKKVLKRVVVVKERDYSFSLILNGNNTIYISRGSTYVDPGYSAYYKNVLVNDDVVVTGKVNSNVVGEYIVKYRIQKGNFYREKERKVIVVNFDYQISLKDSNQYVKENTIVFSTLDDNYDHVLLPDGKMSYDKNINYKIDENGVYIFVIYNKLGFVEKKTFDITNIDKIGPTGICTGYMYDTYTELKVEASDKSGISSYEYYYGNNNSGKIKSKDFKYTEMINKASVKVYDNALNDITFICNMIDKSTVYPSSYNSYVFDDPASSHNMKYWLYIPKNVTKRNPVPLLVYMHGDGGRGDNINLVNGWAYPKFINEGQEFPFMMLAGQINNETNWTGSSTYQRLMRLIDYIIANYSVNNKKIILAGGSSGGGGVYVITANYPKYFSCAVVGSGIYASGYKKFASQLIYTPMWIFHGTNDRIDYNSVESFAKYINTLGGQVKFVGIKGAGHDVTETIDGFNNPQLIEWMISQERS